MHRFFLQQARDRVRLLDFEPGSVFVWPAQSLPKKEMEWDLVDNVDTMFIGCRVGKVALFSSLADGGAQRYVKDEFADIRDLPVHPLQFRELAARLSYGSSLATRTPKYAVMQGSPHKVFQMPLGGLSARPLFYDGDAQTYATYLHHYTGIPIEHLYQPPDGVMTWLQKPSGEPNFISVKDYSP